MGSKRQATLLIIRILTDIFGVSLMWVASYFLRFYTGISTPKGVPDAVLYLKLTPFVAVIWFGVFSAGGFYRRSLGKRSAFLEGIDIFQSCILATLAFIAFTYFYDEYRYSRITLLIFAVTHPWIIIVGRSGIRKALRFYRRKALARHILIIGSGDILAQGIQLAHAADLFLNKILGVVLIGNGDDIKIGKELCKSHGIPILPVPESWTNLIVERNIQGVIFSIPQSGYPYIEPDLELITSQVHDVKVVPDFARYSRFGAGIDVIDGIPIVNIHESPLEGVGGIAKRLIDMIGATVGLVLISPLMLILAVIVKASSPGPILYRQVRMGFDGKTFNCLKFRSMPVDAESSSGPVWAKQGEQRATKAGQFLRRYSLDELPQLINVLRGDMSLVGPRPERPVFVQEFRTKIPGYMLRHKVKAGLTGWAQVNGWRGNTSIEKRIEYDLYYIRNWSIWLDIRIIAKTVAEVFFSKNAY